jgi:AbrB family looped-hinge helix DNA binding protein
MAKFHARLVRWGNSVGISLPKPVRDSLELEPGDEVEIVDTEDAITIKKFRSTHQT